MFDQLPHFKIDDMRWWDTLIDTWEKMIKIQFIISGSLLVYAIVSFVRNLHISQNDDQLEKLYIKEHDERHIFILDKIGFRLFKCVIIVFAIIAVLSPYIDFVMFFGIVSAALVIIAVELILYLYYQKKY